MAIDESNTYSTLQVNTYHCLGVVGWKQIWSLILITCAKLHVSRSVPVYGTREASLYPYLNIQIRIKDHFSGSFHLFAKQLPNWNFFNDFFWGGGGLGMGVWKFIQCFCTI